MPLFLITGINGSGKTAGAIKLLLEDPSFKGMPIYQCGIRELNLPHEPVDPEQVKTWFKWIKKETVLVIDEAQKHFRARPAGSAVPMHVQEMEEHRAHGAHIVLITQGVHLLDTNIRALVNFHYHYENTFMGRYEWAWMKLGDPTSKTSRAEARKTKKPYPKDVFKFYKSAESHLNVKAKIPAFVKIGAVLLLAVPLVIWQAWKHLPDGKALKGAAAVATGAPSMQAVSGVVAVGGESLDQFKPTIEGRPESAPAYSSLRQVQSMPRVASCIASSSRCFCYSQQGTRLREITEDRCRQVLQLGVPFDPYQSPSQNIHVAQN